MDESFEDVAMIIVLASEFFTTCTETSGASSDIMYPSAIMTDYDFAFIVTEHL